MSRDIARAKGPPNRERVRLGTPTLRQVGERIESANRTFITSHFKPDGDALGSAVGLARSLGALGRTSDVYFSGPLEPNLLSLATPTPVRRVEEHPPRDEYDLCVIVDTGAWSQLEPLDAWLRPKRDSIVVIDHHAHGNDIGAMALVNPRAASTTEILLELIREMNWPLTGGISSVAEALFIGLATDTGWFRFDNADAPAFAAASDLLACGVDKTRLYQIIEESWRPQRLALEARALASLEYFNQGAIAMMMLRSGDFAETGGSPEDLSGLINAPMMVGAVRVSILLSQSEPGRTKVSFRSKPRTADGENRLFVDVNTLAQRLGGGGHVHAAGARLNVDIDDARAAVLQALAECR